MSKKLSKNQSELYQRIDEVLHFIWDPIGVCDEPRARDEYHLYLPQIFQLSLQNNCEENIAKYLDNIQTKSMELDSNYEKCIEVAEIISSWSEYLECQE